MIWWSFASYEERGNWENSLRPQENSEVIISSGNKKGDTSSEDGAARRSQPNQPERDHKGKSPVLQWG
jgi:hypothetical protein